MTMMWALCDKNLYDWTSFYYIENKYIPVTAYHSECEFNNIQTDDNIIESLYCNIDILFMHRPTCVENPIKYS